MSYHFLEDIAIADVAFEATGSTPAELFSSSALALTTSMVKDIKTVEQRVVKKVELQADNPEMLLYRFLQELIFYKDAELLLFSRYDLDIRKDAGKWHVNGTLGGEELSQEKHELLADVKAVSLHNFKVWKKEEVWHAEVILDV